MIRVPSDGINKKAVILAVLSILLLKVAWADNAPYDGGRFFFSGDGFIRITGKKSRSTFEGRYRQGSGTYDEKAYRSLCRVFGAPFHPQHLGLSLRFIEFLDFLQDRIGRGAMLTITSGYRTPAYNTLLRNKGALAAKASLHQYGMAADLKITGVDPVRIWDYVKALGFGGTGYYHGDTVHVDVGPARSWDEKTSGVGTGISDGNKLIGLVSDYDRYRPGDMISLRFIRMTAFPISVAPGFELVRQQLDASAGETTSFKPSFGATVEGKCPQFENIDQMANMQWLLPDDLPAGRYIIRAGFCDNPWQTMPSQVATPAIEVIKP